MNTCVTCIYILTFNYPFTLASRAWGLFGFVFKTKNERFDGLGPKIMVYQFILKTEQGWCDGLDFKPIKGGFDWFGPQNREVTDRRTCAGILKLASWWSEIEKKLGWLDWRIETCTILPPRGSRRHWVGWVDEWKTCTVLPPRGYLGWVLHARPNCFVCRRNHFLALNHRSLVAILVLHKLFDSTYIKA